MRRDSFDHRFHKVRTIPKCSWFLLGFKRQPVMDLKLWGFLQQALGDQVKNENTILRVMPWNKQSACGCCTTHVLS